MINFSDLNKSKPYKKLYKLYKNAVLENQSSIEVINLSSYDVERDEVNSRYVNLKFIKNENFVFFTNYESPKAIQFANHPQATIVFFWNKLEVQIRLKGIISRLSNDENELYFKSRDPKKNALAISSSQSQKINSYKKVLENYNKALQTENLKKCPEYWGGFSFKPYYFEFWHGHDSRINQREVYELKDGEWVNFYLQP